MNNMNNILMKELKAFGIHLEPESTQEITITDLLKEEKCVSFLQKQMIEIKAPNLAVTASMLFKRYAYLVVASTLSTMAKYNGVLHLSVKACSLSTERNLYIQEGMCRWQEVEGGKRELWREHILQDLFVAHITPVVAILRKTSRLPAAILWENVAIRINSIYRKMLSKEVDPVIIERVHSDFHFLKNASGDLFALKENPLKPYVKIGEELTLNPYRKTCCLYHQLAEDVEGIGYCSNCPKNDPLAGRRKE